MNISGSSFDHQLTGVASGQSTGSYAAWFRGDACYYKGKNNGPENPSTWKPKKILRIIRKSEAFQTSGSGTLFDAKFHFYTSDPMTSFIADNNDGVYKWFPYNTAINQELLSSYDHTKSQLYVPNYGLNLGRTVDDYKNLVEGFEYESTGKKLENYMTIRNVYGQCTADAGLGLNWWSNPSNGATASKTMVFDQNDIDFRLMSGNLRAGLGRVQQENWDIKTDKETKYFQTDDSNMEDSGQKMINRLGYYEGGPDDFLAQEMSRGTIEVADYYNSQPNPLGGFFGWYEYLVVQEFIVGNDLKTFYSGPDNNQPAGNKSNQWWYGNYSFHPDYNPINSTGGINATWTRKWAKEPCFGYVKNFYDFDPATQEFNIWKPSGPSNGYVVYTQPIAAWKWDLLEEDKIPLTTGPYGLLTDDPGFPTTNAGTRLVGYPFGTDYAFGQKKRDPATGTTYAGRGVWPLWFAYMSIYDVKYIDTIDAYTDLPTKPQPFAVKTTFN